MVPSTRRFIGRYKGLALVLVLVPSAALALTLTFTKVPNATIYKGYARRVGSPWPSGVILTTTPDPTRTDALKALLPVLTPGSYEIAVSASDGINESILSNTLGATIPIPTSTPSLTSTITSTMTSTRTIVPTITPVTPPILLECSRLDLTGNGTITSLDTRELALYAVGLKECIR